MLPALTGRYAVGSTRWHVASAALMANVYYPAEPSDRTPAPYVWDADVLVPELETFFARVPARFDPEALRRYRSHAVVDAEAANGPPFPVVVFSHGKGAGLVQNVSRVEDLASHGYVVVGLEHPRGTFASVYSDGSVVRFDPAPADPERADDWVAQIGAVIEAFAASNAVRGPRRHADLDRVGLMGRAFGGAVMARAATRGQYLAVANLGGIVLDGEAPPNQPYLQLEPPQTAQRERGFCARTRGPAYLASVAGIGTTSISDTPYLPWVQPPPERFLGTLDRERAAHVIGTTIATFFDRHLRGDATASVDALASRYPEVAVETWRV